MATEVTNTQAVKVLLVSAFKDHVKKKIAAVALLVPLGYLLWFNYAGVRAAGNGLLNRGNSAYHTDIAVGDWSFSLLDKTLMARNVVIKPTRLTSQKLRNEMAIANEVKLKLNLSTLQLVSLLWNSYRHPEQSAPLFSQAISDAEVHGAKIIIAHNLVGGWNWELPFDEKQWKAQARQHFEVQSNGKPEGEVDRPAPLSFDVRSISFSDLSIEWTEELPGNSGKGLIGRNNATLHIDGVSLTMQSVKGLFQSLSENLPIDMELDGRTADGRLQAAGKFNPFVWVPSGRRSGVQTVADTRDVEWAPSIEHMRIYLENVNAQRIGAMVPDALVQASEGMFTGDITLTMSPDGAFAYETNMAMKDVKWGVNKNSSLYPKLKPADQARLESSLRNLVTNETIRTSNSGSLKTETFKVVPSMQTSMNTRALSAAPPPVRAAVATDQIRYEDPQNSTQLDELRRWGPWVDVVRQAVRQLPRAPFIPFPGRILPGLPGR